ncbi:MAG: dTDP-4-dehydrorhamnose 3,5-epimerase, partial [Mucinivorans sp.]
IRIVIYDDRATSPTCGQFFEVTLNSDNYQRITIPPDVWVAFSGVGENLNLLLNLANMEHDPTEIERKSGLEDIKYEW